MNGGKLIIRTRLIERLNKELKHKKIVYFGASLGWGKTTAVRQYLDSNNYGFFKRRGAFRAYRRFGSQDRVLYYRTSAAALILESVLQHPTARCL